MKQSIRTALLGLSFALAPFAGAAFADGEAADPAIVVKATEVVTAAGYEVRKVEMEDGMVEVYAVKDGKTWELLLDKEMKIVGTEEGSE